MKEEKRIWHNKIGALESSMLRKFRTGRLLNLLCISYMKVFFIAAIVFITLVLFDLLNGHTRLFELLIQDLRFLAFVQISLLMPIFVDCCIADRLIGKSFELGAEVRHLKKFGWNGRPFHS